MNEENIQTSLPNQRRKDSNEILNALNERNINYELNKDNALIINETANMNLSPLINSKPLIYLKNLISEKGNLLKKSNL